MNSIIKFNAIVCMLMVNTVVIAGENKLYYVDGQLKVASKAYAVYQYAPPYVDEQNPEYYRVDYYYKDTKQLYSSQKIPKEFRHKPLSGPSVGNIEFFNSDGSLFVSQYNDNKGLSQGLSYIYPPNSGPQVNEYVDDKLHGIARFYVPLDSVDIKAFPACTQKIEIGKYETGCIYSELNLGPLETIVYFEKGVETWEKHFYPSGQLESEMPYHDKTKDGVFKWYAKDGQLIHQVNYIQGYKSGIEQRWYKGTLVESCHYMKGELDGKCENWNQDGTLKSVTHYKKNKRNGVEEFYDQQGRLSEVHHWRINYPAGTSIEYYSNGQQASFKDYQNSVRGRPSIEQYWQEDGNLSKTIERKILPKRGEVWIETRFENNGLKWVETTAVKSGWLLNEAFVINTNRKVYHLEYQGNNYKTRYKSGVYYSYIDADGNASDIAKETAYYNNGKYDGEYLSIDKNGDVLAKGKYKKGNKVGHWITNNGIGQFDEFFDSRSRHDGLYSYLNFDSGKKTIKHYQHGKLEGQYIVMDKDGIELTKGEYVNDQKHGNWLEGDEGGLIHCEDYEAKYCTGEYFHGDKVGKWLGFNRQGYYISVNFFNKQGELNGKQYNLTDQGVIDVISIYQDGEIIDTTYYWQ